MDIATIPGYGIFPVYAGASRRQSLATPARADAVAREREPVVQGELLQRDRGSIRRNVASTYGRTFDQHAGRDRTFAPTHYPVSSRDAVSRYEETVAAVPHERESRLVDVYV